MMETNDKKLALIKEINKNRTDQYNILKRITEYRENVDLFKINNDNDFRRMGTMSKAVEKAKSMAEIIKIELDVRKSIDSSAKLEYELRDKLDKELNTSKTEDNIDIRSLVQQIKLIENESQKNNIVNYK
jgi:hypothetical protein